MEQVILKNGLVDRGEGEFESADVMVEGGRIGAVGREPSSLMPAPRWSTAAVSRSCRE